MFSHPTLVLKLLWKGLRTLPEGVGSYAAYLVEPPPIPQKDIRFVYAATPATGHDVMPTMELPTPLHRSEPVDPSLVAVCEPSWLEQAAVLLLAGEGGAAVMFYAAMRGLLPAAQPAPHP